MIIIKRQVYNGVKINTKQRSVSNDLRFMLFILKMYNFESGMNLSHLIHVSNIRPL